MRQGDPFDRREDHTKLKRLKMRRRITNWAAAVSIGLLAGCASTPEAAPKPAPTQSPLGLAAQGFPPRLDRYIVAEFEQGITHLGEDFAWMGRIAARDAKQTAVNITSIPTYLGEEFVDRPRQMGQTLGSLANIEAQNAKQFPKSLWKFIVLLF